MICVVISGLTFMWVLYVRSWNSMAFIEASLEELPVRAELGPRCLAPGPSLLGGSATTGIRACRQPARDGNLCFQNNKLKLDFKTTKFLKSLGSPRTSLERKALGDLMGIIRWLILYS